MVNRRKDLAGVTLGTVTPPEVEAVSFRPRYAAGRRAGFQFLGCSDSLAALRSEAHWAVSTQATVTRR